MYNQNTNRMIKKTFLGLFLLSTVAGWSQDKSTFTLSEAKIYALENHLSIKNASWDVQSAIYKKNETRAIGLPQLNLQGTFNQFINLPIQVVDASFINPNAKPGETISFRAGTNYNSAGSLQVSQLLFNGSYLVGLQVSKQYVEFSKTLESQTKEQVVFSVIQAYNTVAVAAENVRFMDSLLAVTQALIDKQVNYFELGLMTPEDMDQMKYSLLIAKNAVTSAETQYKNAIVLLKLTMNYPIEKEITISEDSETLMNKSRVLGGKIENNIGLQTLSGQKELSLYSLKNERYANLPSLNAYFNQTYNAYRNKFDFFTNNNWFSQTFWGMQLSIPIFSGGQRHYRVKQATVSVMKNENMITQLTQSLKMQEVQAKNNLNAAMEQLSLQKSNLELADRIYKNALVKEQIGSQNSIVVTQKYNQLLQSQTQFTAAKLAVFTEQLNLDKLYNQILSPKN